MTAEADIRTLITRWIDAIRACDLDGVTAAHAQDIVMFDVPPPYAGIRGLQQYRDSWPPFFEFIRSGATFELGCSHLSSTQQSTLGGALSTAHQYDIDVR